MADYNYYELLKLEPSATAEEIRTAFRRLSMRVHPDAGGSEALFREVQKAYETLSDPARREIYDRSGYVDQETQSSDASAPGWRRTDNKPPKKPGPKAKPKADSSSSSYDESSDEPPPPRSPPPPPPPARDQSAARSDGETGATSSALRRRVAANPSWALLAAGVLIIVVGGRSFLFLGFVVAIVGFVGVLGRKKAAHRAAMQRANIVSIDKMSGTEFEQRLQAAFEHIGYSVYHVGGRGDFGADLVLDAPGSRMVVQAKRWSQSVGPGAVQEVVASRAQYGAHHAIVITNSNFTKAALELARSNSVEMWDRSKLIDFLATQDLGPAHTGGALLADELKAGAPTALKGGLIVFLSVPAASATRSKSGRKRKR